MNQAFYQSLKCAECGVVFTAVNGDYDANRKIFDDHVISHEVKRRSGKKAAN